MPSQSNAARADLPAPGFYKRRRKRDNELGQVLLRKRAITPEQLREALRIQAEAGGHVGAILKRMGACDARAISQALLEQVRVSRDRGKARGLARRVRENPSLDGLQVDCKPRFTIALLVALDALSLSLAALIVWHLVSDDPLTVAQRYVVTAIVPMCLAALAAAQLYRITPPSPPTEIRAAIVNISLVYGGAWIVMVLTRVAKFRDLSHEAWLLGWAIAVLLVPSVRGFVRSRLAKRAWWGQPVIVLGAGRVGRSVASALKARPQLGLKPIAILDDDPTKHGSVRVTWGADDIVVENIDDGEDEDGTPSERFALEQFAEVEGVPVVGGFELAPVLSQRVGAKTAVIAIPEMDSTAILGVIERYVEGYTHVLVIPDLFNIAYLGGPTKDLGGTLGIEVQRQLFLRGPRIAKRTMDIALTLMGGLLILPLLTAIVILIKLDSKGSFFYSQKRLGQDGVRFNALKFRTMYQDADRRLSGLLEREPKLRAEYEEFHKLSNDPRVTRIGRVLRKYSLDELPQLWNVMVGDMSLVGPRPYLEREIPDMDQKEAIILRVKPGMTGIWQVVARNSSTFDERLTLDVEYVRNWSPWLDLYLLARTVGVVLGGTGT